LDTKIDHKEGSSSSLSAMAEKNGGGQQPSDGDEESWEQMGTTKKSERERERERE
jgi:hypothetical protein